MARPAPPWLVPLIVAFAAPLIYVQFGFDGFLERDDSIYLYSGQRMAAGVPPYVSVFDQKGPVVPLLCGLGVMTARAIAADDIVVVRIFFLVMSCGAAVVLALLAQRLLQSPRAALLAAFAFLACAGFSRYAASGPQPKTPMVLLQVLSLWLTARRNWFWAGACGALAFLVWQPMAVFPMATFCVALSQPAGQRGSAALRTLAGGVAATLPIVAYFAWQGALFDMIDIALLEVLRGVMNLNLAHAKTGGLSFGERLWTIYTAVATGFPGVSIAIWAGLLAFGVLYGVRRAAQQSWVGVLRDDPYAVLLLTLPAPVLWTMLDFQWFPDFYVFLPYAAIGFAWLLEMALRGVEAAAGTRSARAMAVSIAIMLLALAALELHRIRAASPSLTDQRQAADQIRDSFGRDAPFISIGTPELLVLMQRAHPNRYPFMLRGIDRYIAAHTPGGFPAFLGGIEAQRPAFIGFGQTTGDHLEELLAWLDARYATEQFGPFTVLVPRTR